MSSWDKKILMIMGGLLVVFAVINFFHPQLQSDLKSESEIEIKLNDNKSDLVTEHEYIVPSKYNSIKLKTIEESDEELRYLLHVSWPVTENEIINKILETKAEEFISEYKQITSDIKTSRENFIKETGEDGATFHANYSMHFDIAFANEDYIAFVFNAYKNTGNTGTEEVTSLIFNRQTGEVIPIANLFASANYLIKLSELSREKLYKRLSEEAKTTHFDSEIEKETWLENFKKEMIDEGTEPEEKNFKGLVLNEEGNLEINFDRYQVAPGYWGLVKIEIPLSEIAELFVPEVRRLFNLEVKEEKIEREENKKSETTIVNKGNFEIDCEVEKCIALTFDDGPSIYTETLLETLKEKGAKATFFVLGVNARVQQQTLIDLKKAGMEIGNHTWSHKDLTKLSVEEVKGEINNAADLIESITGERPILVRPPYGAINGQVKAVANSPLILWSVDPEDWKFRNSEYVADYIINHAKAGAVILSHDIHETTVKAMPKVIDSLLSKGYKLVTVSELFGRENLVSGMTYTN